jgi:hypothetical protein
MKGGRRRGRENNSFKFAAIRMRRLMGGILEVTAEEIISIHNGFRPADDD